MLFAALQLSSHTFFCYVSPLVVALSVTFVTFRRLLWPFSVLFVTFRRWLCDHFSHFCYVSPLVWTVSVLRRLGAVAAVYGPSEDDSWR